MFADKRLEFLYQTFAEVKERAFAEKDGGILDNIACSILGEVEMFYGVEMGQVFNERYDSE